MTPLKSLVHKPLEPLQIASFNEFRTPKPESIASHSRQSSTFSSVRYGRVSKTRPSFSILNQNNQTMRKRVFSELAKEHILSFSEAASTGFSKKETDFSGLIEYAKKVYSKDSQDTQAITKRVEDLVQSAKVQEEEWIQSMRQRIENILSFKKPLEIPKVETSIFDQLKQKEFNNFPVLSADQMLLVDKILAPGDGIVVDAFNVELTKRDIHTLRDGKWLNDEVINFYGQLLMKRAAENPKLPKIHFFNTFFFSTIRDQGYDRVRRWTRKIDIFSKDVVIIPVHLGMHWCCSAINFKEKRIEYYDSLLGDNPQLFKLFREYLEKESMDKKKKPFDFEGWTEFCPKNIPSQHNGYDCGVFTCIFAEYCSRQEPFDFSQDNMKYFRKRIVYEIASSDLLIKSD